MISFCWHDWAAWSEIVMTQAAPKQFKYCNKCNKIKHRSVTLNSLSVNTSLWNHKPSNELDD